MIVSNQTIRITSKQDVRFYRRPLAGETEKDQAQRLESYTAKYEFILTFVPRMDEAQFEKTRAERHSYEKSLRAGGESEARSRKRQWRSIIYRRTTRRLTASTLIPLKGKATRLFPLTFHLTLTLFETCSI
jgi:hypothetical protein